MIVIFEEDYLNALETCNHNLHGRVIWENGATPMRVDAFNIFNAPTIPKYI